MDSDKVKYCLFRIGGLVSSIIPPWFGYRCCEILGDFAYYFGPRTTRDKVRWNLQHIVSRDTSETILNYLTRENFRHMTKNWYDRWRLASVSDEEIENWITLINEENLRKAMERGKGVILLSIHTGGVGSILMQIIPIHFKLKGRITFLAEVTKPLSIFEYNCSLRESHGMKMSPIDPEGRGLREEYKKWCERLANNEAIGWAADRNVTSDLISVPLFGTPALVQKGYVKLAWHRGASIVIAFGYRLPSNRYVAVFEPALELQKTSDRERDIEVNLRKVWEVFERYLACHPEQWASLFHELWPLPDEMAG